LVDHTYVRLSNLERRNRTSKEDSMRQRLTTRTAEDLTVKSKGEVKESKGSGIDNDVYDQNDTGHEKNDADRGEYAKGDPSAWAEDVHTKPVNKDDKNREETGHAPLVDKHAAAEAIATVRKLEEKAARCIVAAQRTLPGADRGMIEDQAASYMHMPDVELNATLARQEKLARMIAGAADEAAKEVAEEKKEEKAEEKAEKAEEKKEEAKADDKEACKDAPVKSEEAGKKGVVPPQFAKNVEEKKDEKKEGEKDLPEFLQKKLASLEAEIETLKTAAKKGVSSVNTNKTEMNISNASDEAAKPEAKVTETPAAPAVAAPTAAEECPKAEKKEEKKDDDITFGDEDEGKEASDDSLLDQIFSTVTASADKKGAKTLAGLVKKEASAGSVDLDSILMDGVPPSVNHLFQ
jgi:hypothetical protein